MGPENFVSTTWSKNLFAQRYNRTALLRPLHVAVLSLKCWASSACLPFELLIPADECAIRLDLAECLLVSPQPSAPPLLGRSNTLLPQRVRFFPKEEAVVQDRFCVTKILNFNPEPPVPGESPQANERIRLQPSKAARSPPSPACTGCSKPWQLLIPARGSSFPIALLHHARAPDLRPMQICCQSTASTGQAFIRNQLSVGEQRLLPVACPLHRAQHLLRIGSK